MRIRLGRGIALLALVAVLAACENFGGIKIETEDDPSPSGGRYITEPNR